MRGTCSGCDPRGPPDTAVPTTPNRRGHNCANTAPRLRRQAGSPPGPIRRSPSRHFHDILNFRWQLQLQTQRIAMPASLANRECAEAQSLIGRNRGFRRLSPITIGIDLSRVEPDDCLHQILGIEDYVGRALALAGSVKIDVLI